jgi:hypothetical protein
MLPYWDWIIFGRLWNCSNCVTVYKDSFLLENSSNYAENSLYELQEIQNFLGDKFVYILNSVLQL